MISWREKANLFRGLLTGDTAYAGPFQVAIDLTRRCNLTCLHCRYHSCLSEYPSPVQAPVSDIDPALLTRVLGELKDLGARDLNFAGEGEPLLYPHVRDAVTLAKRAGLHVNLITNGTLLTEDLVEFLVDVRLDLLTVSLWASSEAEYAALYPGTRPEIFGQVLAALQRVTDVKARRKSRRPYLRLHRPISRGNFRSIGTALERACETSCDQFTVTPVHSLKGDVSSYKLPAEEEAEVRQTLLGMSARMRRLGLRHNIDAALELYRVGDAVWKTVPCYVGWVHSRVRVDGTVFTCGRCDLPMGNLTERSFREIWNGERYLAFRRSVSTREGLERMKAHCLCGYCCHIRGNVQIHNIFRWWAPVAAAVRARSAPRLPG